MVASLSSYGQADPSWKGRHDQYWEFVEKNGTAPYGVSLDKSEEELAAWYDEQIVAYKKNELSDKQIYLLEKIPGHSWYPPADEWITNFKIYREIRKIPGWNHHNPCGW
jgi:hypothetical protein